MGRKKAGVVPIKIVSCWSNSGEAVCGLFVGFGIFVVGLWDVMGIENRGGCAGIEHTSCGNTSAVRVFVVRSDFDSSSGIPVAMWLLLARYGTGVVQPWR